MTNLINKFLEDLEKQEEENKIKYKGLENTKETWGRIGSNDSFSELNLTSSELSSFLTEWIKENPYNNI